MPKRPEVGTIIYTRHHFDKVSGTLLVQDQDGCFLVAAVEAAAATDREIFDKNMETVARTLNGAGVGMQMLENLRLNKE